MNVLSFVALLASIFWGTLGVSSSQASDYACTMQYDPVCATISVCPACSFSNPPCMVPCEVQYQTYGNACGMNGEGATFVHVGECTENEKNIHTGGHYTPPPECTAWFDGCNSCSKGSDGSAMCTLRACMGPPAEGYCTSYENASIDPPPDQNPDEPVSSSPIMGSGASGSTGGGFVSPSASAEPSPIPIDEITTKKSMGFFEYLWYSVATWFSSFF